MPLPHHNANAHPKPPPTTRAHAGPPPNTPKKPTLNTVAVHSQRPISHHLSPPKFISPPSQQTFA